MHLFGVGRGSVLELHQACEEFYGNHVGCGPGLLLCRVSDGVSGFHKSQCMLMDIQAFPTKLTLLKCFSQVTLSCQFVNHSLVLLIIYRYSYKVVPCYVTSTEFNGSVHVIVYISASLNLERSEAERPITF